MSSRIDLGRPCDPALDDPVGEFLPEPSPSAEAFERQLYRTLLPLAQVLLVLGIVIAAAFAFLAWGFVAFLFAGMAGWLTLPSDSTGRPRD